MISGQNSFYRSIKSIEKREREKERGRDTHDNTQEWNEKRGSRITTCLSLHPLPSSFPISTQRQRHKRKNLITKWWSSSSSSLFSLKIHEEEYGERDDELIESKIQFSLSLPFSSLFSETHHYFLRHRPSEKWINETILSLPLFLFLL